MSGGRKTFNLEELRDLYWSSEQAERDLLPLVLFRGPSTLGQVQGLWNLTQALHAAQVPTLSKAADFVRENPDVTHAAGLHPTKTEMTPGSSAINDKLWRLSNRVHSAPDVQRIAPDVYAYLRNLMHESRRPLFRLEPIDRYSPWTKQAWRRPPRKPRNRTPAPETVVGPNEAPSPAWPFFRESTPVERMDGAEILVAVDLLIPKGLPKVVREDVCQDVVLAILEGEVTLDELQDRYQDYVRGVFRKFPIKYGHISLDQPPPWDPSGRTLAETLVA